MGNEHVLSVIRNHWDKRASAFNIDHDKAEISRWKKVLSELLGEDKNKSIVDIGTGTRFLANITGKLGYPTVGMDLSTEMLKYAVEQGRKNKTSAIYIEGEASKLPFIDDSVDYIINARFIWTLLEPNKTLEEWFRVIRPGGGILCFNTMKEEIGITVKQRKENFYHDEETDRNLEVYGASMDKLQEKIKSCGFSDVKIRAVPELGEVLKDDGNGEICDSELWYVVIGRKA